MIEHRITILGTHEKILKDWLTGHPNEHERGAIILFKRIARNVSDLPRSDRFITVEIIKMENDWILESSTVHFKINMRKFSEIYFRCETDNFELGFVHNHPSEYEEFSENDNTNEKNILHGLSGCNGKNAFLVSLILVKNEWKARIRQGKNPDEIIGVKHISILSEKITFHNLKIPNESPLSLLRQEAAFGKPYNAKIQSLRAAVVGLGGTGSPLATLLARNGIGELILIDGDKLDGTNMNRVRGYIGSDIDKFKALSLKTYIDSLKLNVTVKAIPEFINESKSAIDALSSADIVFGCTDDIAGRDIMNQALYYYSQVYIDMGLSGNVDLDDNGIPHLRTQKGRVSCILPEYGSCLHCQDVINDIKLASEQKLKDNPELKELDSETLEREYYIFGGGVQSPGIGAFTSGTADNGLATFMNLITGYRKIPSDLRQDNIWIDFIHMNIHSNTPKDNPNCIYCRKYNLLKREGKYRLGIPQYGEYENII